jgi:hypothetical protein
MHDEEEKEEVVQ